MPIRPRHAGSGSAPCAPIAAARNNSASWTRRRKPTSPRWRRRRWPPACPVQKRRRALRELIRLGEAAEADDPKLAALVLEVKLIRLQHKDANILVYTEYADSQRAAVNALRAARRHHPDHQRRRLRSRSATRGGTVRGRGRDRPGQHRLAGGGPEPAPALPPPDPSRSAVQPEPAGTAQRPHRPLRPAQRSGNPLSVSGRHVRGTPAAAADRQIRKGARLPVVHAQYAGGDGRTAPAWPNR